MYIGSFDLSEAVAFYVNTHDPATAGVVDADAAPGYRVYEQETGTPLLTGTMALLDDANTVGLYSEEITVSAANGFERGKSYCIRITGVVGGVTAAALRFFQILAAVNVEAISSDEVAADNLESACDNYSATRGLSGTALPAAAADAAGGLIVSDAGGLDADAQLVTKINDILTDTGTTLQAEVDGIQADTEDIQAKLGTPSDLGSGATVAANLADIEAETDDWNDGQRLDLLLDAVKAKTDGLPSDPADASVVAGLIATAQADLDLLTGSDGATLATSQPNYAPSKAGDAMALTSGERTTLAAAIWNALTSGMSTVGSIGKKLADWTIHSAADVWSVATRVLTAGTNISLAKGTGVTGFNDVSASDVQTSAAAALTAYDPPTRTEATSDKDEILALLPSVPQKNAALTYDILMVDASGDAATGLTVTFQRSLDGAALASAAGSVTEIASGLYKVEAAAADMNGDSVTHRFSATGAKDRVVTFPRTAS